MQTITTDALGNHNPDNHNPERIDALLWQAESVCAGRVHCFGETTSTNDWLMQQSDIHAAVCLAELQTAGRGRRGRSWLATWGSSVLLSLGWRLGDAAAAGLSLVSGLAIIDALHQCGAAAVGLKWPNDLIAQDQHHHGKKLGGVLTELRGAHCVIGMGINVAMPASSADGQTPPPDYTDLAALGFNIDRDQLAARLIIAHCCYLEAFCRDGFAQFAGRWNEHNVHHNRAVSVASPGESFCGTVRGVDEDGALLVEPDDGRVRRVISGEARIRRLDAGDGAGK